MGLWFVGFYVYVHGFNHLPHRLVSVSFEQQWRMARIGLGDQFFYVKQTKLCVCIVETKQTNEAPGAPHCSPGCNLHVRDNPMWCWWGWSIFEQRVQTKIKRVSFSPACCARFSSHQITALFSLSRQRLNGRIWMRTLHQKRRSEGELRTWQLVAISQQFSARFRDQHHLLCVSPAGNRPPKLLSLACPTSRNCKLHLHQPLPSSLFLWCDSYQLKCSEKLGSVTAITHICRLNHGEWGSSTMRFASRSAPDSPCCRGTMLLEKTRGTK